MSTAVATSRYAHAASVAGEAAARIFSLSPEEAAREAWVPGGPTKAHLAKAARNLRAKYGKRDSK